MAQPLWFLLWCFTVLRTFMTFTKMSATSETVGVADTMEQCVTIQSMLLGEIQCVLSSLRQRFGFGAALGSWEENNAKTQVRALTLRHII